jgi:hypothetical protein
MQNFLQLSAVMLLIGVGVRTAQPIHKSSAIPSHHAHQLDTSSRHCRASLHHARELQISPAAMLRIGGVALPCP